MKQILRAAGLALAANTAAHASEERDVPEYLTCTYDAGGSFTLHLERRLIRDTNAPNGYTPGYVAHIISPPARERTLRVDTNPEGPIVIVVLSAYSGRGLEIQYKFVNKNGGWKFGHAAEDRQSQSNGNCRIGKKSSSGF